MKRFSLSRGLPAQRKKMGSLYPSSFTPHAACGWVQGRHQFLWVCFVSGLADRRHTGPKEKASWDVEALPRNQPEDPGEFLDLRPQLENRRLESAHGCWDAQQILSQECPRVLFSEA